MKPSFHCRLVNGPFDDPSLYVRMFRQRRALLFDIGDISRLDSGDLLKISDVFVTHTHIDHFVGFDTLLRAVLRRETPLCVYGPSNIISCIEGKLAGYTWNLIADYPLEIEVFAIDGNILHHSSFRSRESFRRMDREDIPFNGTLLSDEGFRVQAMTLEHDIPSLGFRLEEDYHINIDKAALSKMNLPVGPWLAELKRAMRQGLPEDTEIMVEGKSFRLGALRKVANITDGQKLAYVMDAAPDIENIEKISRLVKGADVFYCEAYFLEVHIDRARERNHLTAALVGKLARESGVKNLVVTHFSQKYRGADRTPEDEALEAFERREAC